MDANKPERRPNPDGLVLVAAAALVGIALCSGYPAFTLAFGGEVGVALGLIAFGVAALVLAVFIVVVRFGGR